jgi:hypothetical protein
MMQPRIEPGTVCATSASDKSGLYCAAALTTIHSRRACIIADDFASDLNSSASLQAQSQLQLLVLEV